MDNKLQGIYSTEWDSEQANVLVIREMTELEKSLWSVIPVNKLVVKLLNILDNLLWTMYCD